VRPLSRYIWARLSRAVTWRQLSHRQLSVKSPAVQATACTGDCQVARHRPIQSRLSGTSPAAPYSRFSGRLRRATGPVESTIRSSVPATGRLRRQSTQSRLIKSRSHHSHGLYQSGPLPTGIFALVPRPRPGSGRQQIFQSFADVLARLGIFLFWLHRSQLYCPFVFNSALWAGSRSASSRIASRGPATSGVKEVTACGSYGIIWLGSGRMCLPAQRELPSGEIRIFQLAMASRVGL
jgi:hypothetical protein